MTDTLRALFVTAVASGAGFAWLALRTSRLERQGPERLVGELRLAQVAALLLAFVAGAYLGFAASASTAEAAGLDVALALVFFVAAAVAPTRDPGEALVVLALAFGAHAVVDILHRPGALPVGVVPQWYLVGCAVYNVALGALCYLPLLRRG
ncbi:MAG: hypothetical protein QGF21_07700 [Vicinamibacterales bacterium]|nr:hypothetical protein [Acidobacteriota bacterium]MDP7471170.1 hypothetical protein [Vicinamibacterales bacterium]MDP7671811.1 hypothetical protein [Vicinamibacterales bacterium]HJO38673.1 hypothetical protein [Vicinamibacterales bacterium]